MSIFCFGKGGKGKSSSSKDDEARSEAKEGGFVKAKTGGFTSQATLLVNDTNKTLYLRDKVGAAYGGTRYKILGNSHIEVSPLQHTFFKMLAYAVEEEESADGKPRDGEDSQQSNASKEKTVSTDTKLTIDSDQLADNKKIVITCNGTYQLSLTPR